MVTKRQLQQETQRANKQAALQKAKDEMASKLWRSQYEEKNLQRALTLLDGELGAALKRWNTNGLRQIKLDENRVWRVEDGGEVYSDPFDLGFVPVPGYKPTETLLACLIEAGFRARISSEEKQNVEWQHCGDGMGPVSVDGTHIEHYLIIDWR